MTKTTLPSPEEIVKRHRSLLGLIVRALQKGTYHAREYADWQDESVDRSLAPAHVRKGAKRFLNEKGESARDEEPVEEWETEYLSNLGLAMSAEGVRIRILKSDHGNLPIPGPSKARQRFYSQQLELAFEDPTPEDEEGAETVAPPVNLVVHWSTDDEYNLERVSLAAPRAGDLTRRSVRAYFDEPIWRRRRYDVVGEQVEAEATDLDIHLDSEDTGKPE